MHLAYYMHHTKGQPGQASGDVQRIVETNKQTNKNVETNENVNGRMICQDMEG